MVTVTEACPEENAQKRTWLKTRLFSITALCGAVCAIGYVGKTIYNVATDSFVVPVVLSPDSDLVIQSKLNRAALMAEQLRSVTKKEQIDAELIAAEQAIDELKVLQASASKSLEWTTVVTRTQATAGVSDLRALTTQRNELSRMVASQEELVDQMKKELDAGLLSKTDYAREVNTLRQLRVAAIENDRTQLSTGVQMSQVVMTQQALRTGRGGMATPEMLLQQDQLVRIKCDLLKLEAERRAKTSERRHIDEELTKIEELLAQLNRRPIFRAIDASTNVAFIPYSQIEGVAMGGKVYECVWGVFSCTPVGKVSEVLPGEVIVPDPWGSPARGQYAVIQLDDQHAALSKTLRVRPTGTKVATVSPVTPTPSLASK